MSVAESGPLRLSTSPLISLRGIDDLDASDWTCHKAFAFPHSSAENDSSSGDDSATLSPRSSPGMAAGEGGTSSSSSKWRVTKDTETRPHRRRGSAAPSAGDRYRATRYKTDRATDRASTTPSYPQPGQSSSSSSLGLSSSTAGAALSSDKAPSGNREKRLSAVNTTLVTNEYSGEELERIKLPPLPLPLLKQEKNSTRYSGTVQELHFNRYGRSKRITYGFIVPDKTESLGDYVERSGVLQGKMSPQVRNSYWCRIFFHSSEVLNSGSSSLPDTNTPVTFEIDFECDRGNGLRAYDVRFGVLPTSQAGIQKAPAAIQKELASIRESIAQAEQDRKSDLAALRTEMINRDEATEARVKEVETAVTGIQTTLESSIKKNMEALKEGFVDLVSDLKDKVADQVHSRMQQTLLSDSFLRQQQDRVEGLTQRSQPSGERNGTPPPLSSSAPAATSSSLVRLATNGKRHVMRHVPAVEFNFKCAITLKLFRSLVAVMLALFVTSADVFAHAVDLPVPGRFSASERSSSDATVQESGSDATIGSIGSSPGGPWARAAGFVRSPRPPPRPPPPAAAAPSRLWPESARPAHPPRSSFHNSQFLEQLLDALGGLSADTPLQEPGGDLGPPPGPAPSAASDEYNFEDPPAPQPAVPSATASAYGYRTRRAIKRRRIRVRANADEVNVLSLNAQGRGESESLHSRIRHLIRRDHGPLPGAGNFYAPARPPIDAIFLQEFSYTKIGADAPEWKSGPGQVLWQFGEDYDIVFSNGAGIVIVNELWRKWVRDERCETFGCPRAVALRLPSLSLVSVYAPAAGGNARKNDVEWWHFTDYLLKTVHWARRVPRGSESKFAAGNRTTIVSSDNCGVIGDRQSREKKGYVAGLTSGPFGLPETSDRGVDALQLFEEARVVLANSYFDQPSGTSPLGLSFSEGRETHFSRRAGGAAGGRWRELDHMWVDAASIARVRACGTIDFGVSDHRSKYLSIGIDRQLSHQASRRASASSADGDEPSPPPAPRVPLWRATDEAKSAFSRQVESALAAASPEGPDLKFIPAALGSCVATLEASAAEELEHYNASHDVKRLQVLRDEVHRARFQMRILEPGSLQHQVASAQLCAATNRLTEFRDGQKGEFNVEAHAKKQRDRKKQEAPFEFDPEVAAEHFKKVANNELVPRLDIVARAVSPLSETDASFLSADITGEELHYAAQHSALSRQSDSLKDDIQRYRALDVAAWRKIAVLLNPAWRRGLADLEDEANSELMEATVALLWKRCGKKDDLDNYRGIVNKSIFSKIITAVMARRWQVVLERTGIYSPSQNGFRQGFQVAELIFVWRRLSEDVRLQLGSSCLLAEIVGFLEADVRKAYPSFSFPVFLQVLRGLGVEDSPYGQSAKRLHLCTRYVVQTPGGRSSPYLLSSGFGEGDRRSPGDFAGSCEFLIRVFRGVLRQADPGMLCGVHLYCPRDPFAVENRRGLLSRADPSAVDLTFRRIADFQFADDTAFPGGIAPDLVQYASWSVGAGTGSIRDNPDKPRIASLANPRDTASVRLLGNWLDREYDTRRRSIRMGWALNDLSRVHGAAASATETKVNSVSLVRSRGSFGCETRPWSTAEIDHLQSFENTALLMLTGRKRYQLRMYGTRLAQLRCQLRVEPLVSFIRYMQASEIGHLVRAPSWRISREALFGVFTLPGLGDVERRWLSEHRRGRETATLWDQAKATVELSTGPISDDILVALARSRQLWTRVILESRVLLTMRDYEAANAGRAEAGKRLLLTPDELRLAQVFWTTHFGTKLGFTFSDTFSSFREWCTYVPGSQPVFHATEEGLLLKRLYEETASSASKLTCRGEGCSFCVDAPGGEMLSDDRFSFTCSGYDCIPCPTVGADAFAAHPCTVLEDHELSCPAAQASARAEQERWHVAEGVPDLRDEVRSKLHGLAELPGTLGHLYRAVGAERLDSILDAEPAPPVPASSAARFSESLATDHFKIVREVQLFEHFQFTQSGDGAIAENAGRFERRYDPSLSEAERAAAPRLTGIFCKCPRCFSPADELDLWDIDVRGRKLSSLRVAFLHMREIKQSAAAGQLAPLVTEAMQKKKVLEPPADAPPVLPAVAVAGAPAVPAVPAPPPVPAPVAAEGGACPPKKRLVGRDGSLIDLPVGLTATGRNGDRILVSVPAHAFTRTINPSTFNTDAGAVQAATRLRAQVIRDPLAFSRRSRGSL